MPRYELIQFTKVFFCTRSCSSEKRCKKIIIVLNEETIDTFAFNANRFIPLGIKLAVNSKL